jgi:hypothetical protein
MGNNREPGNNGDDYLSIFNPSPGALLVRLQVTQHFTMTVATRHILQMKQRSLFVAKSSKRVCRNRCYFCNLFYKYASVFFLDRVESTSDNNILSLYLNSWKRSELLLTILSRPVLELILPSVRQCTEGGGGR